MLEVSVPKKGVVDGQVVFTYPEGNDSDAGVVGFTASMAASVMFERLQAQGTNILISLDDEKGVRVDILARKQNDGVNLQWTPAQVEPAQMESIRESLSDAFFSASSEEESLVAKPGPSTQLETSKTEKKEPSSDDDECTEHLRKQLTRCP
jgi:hypothetical protein